MKKILLVAVVSAAGCGASNQQLQTRAGFDLNCPAQQVNVVELDKRTRGAEGCGKKATYIENCAPKPFSFGMQCTWVLNSNTQAAVTTPATETATPPPASPPSR
jgi:hypothetical protein